MTELITDRYAAAEVFVDWLRDQIVQSARTADGGSITGKPSDRFWLGRVSPTQISAQSASDPRMERLEPCQVGMRVLVNTPAPWKAVASIHLVLWQRAQSATWQRLTPIDVEVELSIHGTGPQSFGQAEIGAALSQLTGRSDLNGEVRVEPQLQGDATELTITFVNRSSLPDGSAIDPRFYEVELAVDGLPTAPFQLHGLEDTFRYDRRISAYGVNGGVVHEGQRLTTGDVQRASKWRTSFWGASTKEPSFSFGRLQSEPVEAAEDLVSALRSWGDLNWSAEELERRRLVETWTPDMFVAAQAAADAFWIEVERVHQGAKLLRSDPTVRQAFVLMNTAMQRVGKAKGYPGWRAFQLGFLLANLACLDAPEAESGIVDIVWFATGGGKTETYLGLLTAAAFHDRLTGKAEGCTAWSRFPLRLLSLQQMQRFADALAAAELTRRESNLPGAPFSLGFLVGDRATPNKVRRPEQEKGSQHDPDDPSMPDRFRLLQRCPFCGSKSLRMAFNSATWTLEHRCPDETCPWPEEALPFFVVDEEVFRFLPTVVVGTLDKAALVGMQQAMRGLVAAPLAKCPIEGHGYTYNQSSKSPHGCLVPDCGAAPSALPIPANRYAPSFRLQDELHLLRDSLGAVDAHYEAILDGLQRELTGRTPKIVASSATLAGYQKQSAVLYRRGARVFPQPSPSPTTGFWTLPTDRKMREFSALAPRGATVEFAVDRMLSELQIAIRRLVDAPENTCRSIGIDPKLADFLVDQYGTNVVYGNTLRDLEAVARSSGTQLVGVQGDVNIVTLTGRTQFEDVSGTLDRLEQGDSQRPFNERIHVVTASSMMSHGVDIDRLNVMVMLGVPLTTAEFIQATARVGRKWPALVFVIHKMARERDAGVYRLFPKFVEHGDRLVEPVPITRRSRRVLERTLSGVEMSRLLHVHAAASATRFTTASAVRQALKSGAINTDTEAQRVVSYLGYDASAEENHIHDIEDGLERYWERIESPQTAAYEWFGNVWGERPMRSLRDVDEQVPVHLKR